MPKRMRWKKKGFNLRLERIFSAVGNQLGARAEELVEQAFVSARERGSLPRWIRGWNHARQYSPLDLQGIDFAFSTDVGVLNVNIKSSEGAVREFHRQRGDTAIRAIAIDVRQPEQRILNKVLQLLNGWRQEKLHA